MIYQEGKKTIPVSIGSNQHVYKPEGKIPNLRFSPWGQGEFDSWKARLPSAAQQDATTIEALGAIPPFFMIPAHDVSDQQYVYEREPKHKIKVFSNICLKDVVEKLRTKATKQEPVVINPLTCNAKPGHDKKAINFDFFKQASRKNLTDLVGTT